MAKAAVSEQRAQDAGPDAAPGAAQSGPRSPKGERTRARLIDAAREVFERDGFLTARIADIARTAGLSQGSFYHYFESKEQIFREVAAAQEQRLTAPDPDARAHDTATPRAVIGAANLRYFERYRDAVNRVTFWGLHDRRSWRSGQSPLAFDRDGRPKPALDAIVAAAPK